MIHCLQKKIYILSDNMSNKKGMKYASSALRKKVRELVAKWTSEGADWSTIRYRARNVDMNVSDQNVWRYMKQARAEIVRKAKQEEK